MEKMELIAPCHFGMEAVLKREVLDLGYEISTVEDGRVCFWGDAQAICDANVFLRTAERILLKVGSFKAETFDELFEGIKALPWEEYIPENGKFYGWLTGMGGSVRILKPKKSAAAYRDYLKSLAKDYKGL